MGVRKNCMIVLCFLILGAQKGHATPVQTDFLPVMDPGKTVALINKNAANINTIHSSFIQKKHLDFLEETILSKGAFWFKRENMLKWAYYEPFEYVIAIRDGVFRIKDGQQVSSFDIESNTVFMEINNLIVGMVRGNITDEKFDMEVLENSRQYLVRLFPKDKNMKEVISSMEIIFEKSDLNVAEVIMKENENDYTVITFTDKQINVPIEDSVFSVDY